MEIPGWDVLLDETEYGYREIPTDAIIVEEDLREELGDLDELARSIEKVGLLQPVIVTPRDGQYKVIAGGRRVRAARKAGLKTIPALVIKEQQENFLLSITENIVRKNFTPAETIRALKKVKEWLAKKMGVAEEKVPWKEVGEALGLSPSTISNYLAMAKLPEEERGIPVRIASELAKVPPEVREEIVRRKMPSSKVKKVIRMVEEGREAKEAIETVQKEETFLSSLYEETLSQFDEETKSLLENEIKSRGFSIPEAIFLLWLMQEFPYYTIPMAGGMVEVALRSEMGKVLLELLKILGKIPGKEELTRSTKEVLSALIKRIKKKLEEYE